MTGAERLGTAERRLMLQLADPLANPPDKIGDDARLLRLLDAAERHGILPIVWRKMAGAAASPALRARRPEIEGRLVRATGQSLLLSHHAARLSQRLRDAGVPFAVVKGEVFARRLYPIPSDRPFTDVDFLVDEDHFDAANRAFEGTGFRLAQKPAFDKSDSYREYKWVSAENPSLLIEVHGDLVHYPKLRAKLSFGYRKLVAAGGGDPEAPSALLLTAIVHAALGHKFHALRLLVDVLQGVRALPPGGEGEFEAAAFAARLSFEAAVCIDYVGRLFGDPRALALAERFPVGTARGLSRRLLTPSAVADAPYPANRSSRARRLGFRLVQHLRHRIG